jgi:NAD(P)-dependent dehydrogenase (short-subunit alcohol dehydrogenase family)
MTSIAGRFSMTGRRALVTGASLSMGREIAILFAQAGADVAVHHSSAFDARAGAPGAAAEVASAIAALGRRSVVIDADLAGAGAGRRTVAETIAAFGGLDVLVVCASVQHWQALEEVTSEAIEHQVRVDLAATIELLQAALPGMRERGWGRVLTMGSINQKRPHPSLAVYAALKDAQRNLALGLARRYARHGVMVNNLAPGLVATERNRFRRADPEEWRRIESRANPMERAARPEEIAPAALLLCSEAASFIAGADLDISGGGHL